MSTRSAHGRTTRRLIVAVLIGGSGLGLLLPGAASAYGTADLSLVCWVLVIAGIVGTMLAGRGVGWGWLLLFGLQPLWVGYAVATEQYGFVVSAVAFSIGQLQGYLRSRSPVSCR
jgi:hypothetical protein